MLTVREIMSTNPVTLSPENTLREAIERMALHHCSDVPVVVEQQVVGTITELELFDVLFDHTLQDAPVADHMTSQVRAIVEDESVGHAAHLCALYGVRCLPVLRGDKLVGLVSRSDILVQALHYDRLSGELGSDFIPFLDEPETDGQNQAEFLQELLV